MYEYFLKWFRSQPRSANEVMGSRVLALTVYSQGFGVQTQDTLTPEAVVNERKAEGTMATYRLKPGTLNPRLTLHHKRA